MPYRRFAHCRFSAATDRPAWSACNESRANSADARAPSCSKARKSSPRARSPRHGLSCLDREQATSPGYAARAALRAILAKDPLGRWSTGSNDVPIIDDRSAAPGERECRPPESCAFYRRLSVGILSVLSRPTRQHSPHSHSTIPRNSNALILRRKSLPPATKNRLLDPSEIPALDFAGEFPQFKNWSVSATIGINWSICDRSRNDRKSLKRRKNTVTASSAEPDSSQQRHHCKRSARGCATARSIATQLPAAIPAMLRPRQNSAIQKRDTLARLGSSRAVRPALDSEDNLWL
jgi:hypothetical protein